MSGTSNLHKVTTTETIQRPLSQSSTASSNFSATKELQDKSLKRLAYLNARTFDSKMAPNTPRDSFSSTEDRLRRSGSYTSQKSKEDRHRYNNSVYHYGRHSNQWLFGGFSVRDTVRDGVDWIRQQKKG
ncbi:hypothetical protein BJY04DRAFT_221584 [Aspergillus karnatakaensis]|uniref:uncharacterized protein n=1 Tax=Aspergillus karnatakaensis TaxID=1810916 RepID=UPI003CCCD312